MDEKVEIILSEKVAVLVKNDKFAAIGLAIRPWGTTLAMCDVNGVSESPQYSPLSGIEKFHASVATSVDRGWKLSYFGVPNFG